MLGLGMEGGSDYPGREVPTLRKSLLLGSGVRSQEWGFGSRARRELRVEMWRLPERVSLLLQGLGVGLGQGFKGVGQTPVVDVVEAAGVLVQLGHVLRQPQQKGHVEVGPVQSRP